MICEPEMVELEAADAGGFYANDLEQSAYIHGLLSKLDGRDRDVITRRFEGETCKDIAEDYKLSSSRILQIEGRALRRLRKMTRGESPYGSRPGSRWRAIQSADKVRLARLRSARDLTCWSDLALAARRQRADNLAYAVRVFVSYE